MMPGRRSNRSNRDNSRFKQRKIQLKATDTQKITMALATAGMCRSGGPQRSLFNLLANGNGDETIPKYWRRLPKPWRIFVHGR